LDIVLGGGTFVPDELQHGHRRHPRHRIEVSDVVSIFRFAGGGRRVSKGLHSEPLFLAFLLPRTTQTKIMEASSPE
jgi:hypothetical protein